MGISVLHLAEDISLTNDLRVEAAGDFEGVLERFEVGMPRGVCVQQFAAYAVASAEAVSDFGFYGSVTGEAIHFNTVASIDDQTLVNVVESV
jgi:hypothetical protein